MDLSPLEELLAKRRTTRSFGGRPISWGDLAAILWAAHGGSGEGHRTSPSAHTLHPVTVTVVAGDVDGENPGVHVHDPDSGSLRTVVEGDHRATVAAATLADSEWVRTAPVLLLLTADIGSANEHFAEQPPRGRRGERYVWLEAGHISQNIYLRATEIGLGAALVAGLQDDAMISAVPPIVPVGHHPLGLIALGHPG